MQKHNSTKKTVIRANLKLPVLLMFCVCLLMAGLIQASGLQRGMQAYQRGDYLQAHKIWMPLAEQGESQAQFFLSQLYNQGHGVEKDPVKAIDWLKRAAKSGMLVAYYNLGNHYQVGNGVEQDLTQAVMWWRKAAIADFSPAQYNLGGSYQFGRGLKKDIKQARYWYQQAANLGLQEAKLQLQNMAMGEASDPADQVLKAPIWIGQQDPGALTLQLATSRDYQQAKKLAEGVEGQHPVAIYQFKQQQTELYAVIYGCFDNPEQASLAMTEITPAFAQQKPWLIPFSKVIERCGVYCEHGTR